MDTSQAFQTLGETDNAQHRDHTRSHTPPLGLPFPPTTPQRHAQNDNT